MNKRNCKWEVYWNYSRGTHQAGERVSRHVTYEAAEKKCKNDCGFWAIREV